MKKRPKNKQFTSLSELIDTLISGVRIDRNVDVLRLWDDWEWAVGVDFSMATRPVLFKDDILLLHVKSASWLHQIQFQERELIERVNTYLGAIQVRQIRFKIGDIETKPPTV